MAQSLLIAVPTYNRPRYVAELISECAPVCLTHNADIMIYDSSETDETKEIVETAGAEHGNVAYLRVDPISKANEKFLKIMQGYGWKRAYDYVWVWGDSLRYTDDGLSKVCDCMEAGHDIIITDIMNKEALGDREYNDAQKLFDDLCWYMTLFGGVALKRETMLDGTDWGMIDRKYMTPDTLYYCQVGLYFERIADIPSFSAYHLALSPDEGYMRKREDEGWFRQRIEFFCVNWINTINALPDNYKRKEETIKKYPIFSGAFSNRSTYMMKMDGILDWKKYREYKDRWPMLTQPKTRLWLLLNACLPKWLIFLIFNSGVLIKSVLRKVGLVK